MSTNEIEQLVVGYADKFGGNQGLSATVDTDFLQGLNEHFVVPSAL